MTRANEYTPPQQTIEDLATFGFDAQRDGRRAVMASALGRISMDLWRRVMQPKSRKLELIDQVLAAADAFPPSDEWASDVRAKLRELRRMLDGEDGLAQAHTHACVNCEASLDCEYQADQCPIISHDALKPICESCKADGTWAGAQAIRVLERSR